MCAGCSLGHGHPCPSYKAAIWCLRVQLTVFHVSAVCVGWWNMAWTARTAPQQSAVSWPISTTCIPPAVTSKVNLGSSLGESDATEVQWVLPTIAPWLKLCFWSCLVGLLLRNSVFGREWRTEQRASLGLCLCHGATVPCGLKQQTQKVYGGFRPKGGWVDKFTRGFKLFRRNWVSSPQKRSTGRNFVKFYLMWKVNWMFNTC